jgi:Family of unknown function (DUF6338)
LSSTACGSADGQLLTRRPSGKASSIALASLAFSVFAVVLLAAVRTRLPTILPDPGQWLEQGSKKYLPHHYQLVAGAFLAESVLAITLAAAWSWLLGRGREARIRRVSTWYQVFRELPPKGTDTFVRVLVQGGMEYFGKVISYTTDFDLADRELFLGEPLWRRLPDEPAFTRLHPPWRWLLLPGPAIEGIWVSYLQQPPEDTGKKSQ